MTILNYKKTAFLLIIAGFILCAGLIICFLTFPKDKPQDNDREQNEPQPSQAQNEISYYDLTDEQKSLFLSHRQYFRVDASNGLDVYVWQMAKNSYSFGLLPHSDTPRTWLDEELFNMKGVRALSMRHILAAYDLPEEMIHIVPWQNPLSSYIGDAWIVSPDEDIESVRQEYIEGIREMLFGEITPMITGYHDTKDFDIDGDGSIESCRIGYCSPSALAAFTLETDQNDGDGGYFTFTKWHIKYPQYFLTLSFKECEDGKVRIEGVTEDNATHLFDIDLTTDYKLVISENGNPLSMIDVMEEQTIPMDK